MFNNFIERHKLNHIKKQLSELDKVHLKINLFWHKKELKKIKDTKDYNGIKDAIKNIFVFLLQKN